MSLELSDLLVLLVEPSRTQRNAMTRLLNQRGVTQIEYADKGNQAFDAIQSQKPDLVISSLYLEDMTGSELVRAMRRDSELDRVPFVLISSETRFCPLDPVRQAGVVSIINKSDPENGLDAALINTLAYLEPSSIDLNGTDPEDVRIGIVDDSKMARNHMRKTLIDLGFRQIFEAEDGLDGQRLITEQILDIVVTDLHMPGLNGFEFCTWLRHHSSQPELPVLAVTSETDDELLDRLTAAGADELCVKPFDISHLRTLLPKLLD